MSENISGGETLDPVAAVESGEMLDLLARLVEAPTTLGSEGPGPALMEEACREIGGLEPFGWGVAGERDVVAGRLLETSAA